MNKKHNTSSNQLPTLPLLIPNCNQPIEKLVSKRHGSEFPHFAAALRDFTSVSYVPVRRPSDCDFGFPSETSDLLDLNDVLNFDGENRMVGLKALRVAFSASCCCAGEGENRISITRGDDNPSLTALVAAFEFDGT